MGREKLIADMKALLDEVEKINQKESSYYTLGYMQSGVNELMRNVKAGEYDD